MKFEIWRENINFLVLNNVRIKRKLKRDLKFDFELFHRYFLFDISWNQRRGSISPLQELISQLNFHSEKLMTSNLATNESYYEEDFSANQPKIFLDENAFPSPFLSNPSATNGKFHWRHSIFEYPAILFEHVSSLPFLSLTVSIKIITELFDQRRKRIIG